MTRKRVLVLGGTGFIGRNVVEHYDKDSENWEITATHFTRKPYETQGVVWKHCDLRKDSEVQEIIGDFDLVIQAAATTSGIDDGLKRPDLHMTDNAVMNSQILRRVNQCAVGHFIFFSCTTMLQSSPNPQSEVDFDANLEMFPSYFGVGWTKVYIEKLCEFYSRQSNNTRFTVIRHSNVYGPHDKFDLKRSHVFGASITKVMEAKASVEIWGSGKERRDLIYITDLISLIDLAFEKQRKKFDIFNCGNSFVSVEQLVCRIIALAGKEHLKIEYDLSKPNVSFEALLDTSYAKSVLGWSPKIDLDLGVIKTLEFWRSINVKS